MSKSLEEFIVIQNSTGKAVGPYEAIKEAIRVCDEWCKEGSGFVWNSDEKATKLLDYFKSWAGES